MAEAQLLGMSVRAFPSRIDGRLTPSLGDRPHHAHQLSHPQMDRIKGGKGETTSSPSSSRSTCLHPTGIGSDLLAVERSGWLLHGEWAASACPHGCQQATLQAPGEAAGDREDQGGEEAANSLEVALMERQDFCLTLASNLPEMDQASDTVSA